MRNTPFQKDSNKSPDEDLHFRPLRPIQFEESLPSGAFNYLSSYNGPSIFHSLIQNPRNFSPIPTPKDARKKNQIESVFKTPNSRNIPSFDKQQNGLGTPESK